jgi:5-methylcytosine-specific restriction endonuclease McrA
MIRSDIKAKSEKLRAIKAQPCLDCGLVPPSCAMDFDHKVGKIQKISAMALRRNWGAVLEEIAKCDLVCARCHRLRTQQRRAPRSGWTTLRYRYHKIVIDTLKEKFPCTDCSGFWKACQMDFDHVGPKTASIGHLLSEPVDVLLAELQNCELVCVNCHRVRTAIGVGPNRSSMCLNHEFEEISLTIPYPDDRRLVRAWHPLVGTRPDHEIAKLAGVSRSAVSMHRRKVGVQSFRSASAEGIHAIH